MFPRCACVLKSSGPLHLIPVPQLVFWPTNLPIQYPFLKALHTHWFQVIPKGSSGLPPKSAYFPGSPILVSSIDSHPVAQPKKPKQPQGLHSPAVPSLIRLIPPPTDLLMLSILLYAHCHHVSLRITCLPWKPPWFLLIISGPSIIHFLQSARWTFEVSFLLGPM